MSNRITSQAGTVQANLLSLGIAEGVARLAQLAIIGLLGRVLGPAGLGVVGVAWAAYQLALPFVQYAPELMGTRNLARGEDVRRVVVDLTIVKLVIACIAALPMLAAAIFLFNDEPDTKIQVAVQTPLLLVIALNGVWAFRGLRQFGAFAIVRTVAVAALLIGLAIGLNIVAAAWMVPVVEGIVGLAAAGLAAALLFRSSAVHAGASAAPRTAGRWQQLIDTVQFGTGSFFAGAVWSIPLLVGASYMDADDQGHLAAALRLIVAVNGLFQLVLQVFHPVLAERYGTDREAGCRLAAALLVYSLAATIPATVILALAAPWIVEPLLGPAFAEAANLLAILSTTIVPTIVGSVFGYCLLADGRYALYVWISAAGALAAASGCWIAFSWVPRAEAAAVVPMIITVIGLACGVAVWRLDLVRFSAVRWAQLAPSQIRAVLRQR